MKYQNYREKAATLIDRYIKSNNLKKHSLAVENLMRHLARRYGEDEEKWALAGLLHDLDWDLTKETPERHTLITEEILKKEGFPEDIIIAIKKHHPVHGLQPETLLEKALFCCEEITGLITAVVLVMPNRSITEVTLERVLKKFKEPSFAKGVNREVILKSKELLNLDLEELIKIGINSMIEIQDKLGL